MGSSANIKNSVIREQHLAPHLRRRVRGGGNSYSVVTSGATPTAGDLVASYTHSTSQSLTVPGWEAGALGIALDTSVVASGYVTGSDPWTFAGSGLHRAVVSLSVDVAPCVGGILVALVGGSGDVASTVLPPGDSEWVVEFVAQSTKPVTLEVRACALDSDGGSVDVTSASVELYAT